MKKRSYFEKLSSQIVLAMRGRESQSSLSESLGYKSNQVSKWETGQAEFDWLDFVRVAKLRGFSIADALNKVVRPLSGVLSIKQPGKIIAALSGGTHATELSKSLRISTATASRLLRGQLSPTLAQMLEVFDFSNLLEVFLLELFEPQMLPLMTERLEKVVCIEELFARLPEAALIYTFLTLPAYKNLKSGAADAVASALQIEGGRCALILQELINADLIKLKGARFECQPYSISLQRRRHLFMMQLSFWHQWMGRLPPNANTGKTRLRSFSVCAVSQSVKQKLAQLSDDFNSKFMRLVAEDAKNKNGETLVIMTMGLVEI